jgi:hypothetical protein
MRAEKMPWLNLSSEPAMLGSQAQRRELAQTIANHAQALADGNVLSEHAAVSLLQHNIATLSLWTPDDRR